MFPITRFKEDTLFIKDIESLLKKKLEGKVSGHKVQPLLASVENFGSEILGLEVTTQENGQQKILHGVAKLIPPSEMQMKFFNTQISFKNEIGFYAEIVPLLQDFQKQHQISLIADYFPELYGARINLNPNSEVVDEDAVIVLENLKTSGYDNMDKMEGFDLETTKLILGTLANFQATAVILRKKKPAIFDTKVKSHLTEWVASKPPLNIDDLLKENPKVTHLMPKVHQLLSPNRVKTIREPWATVVLNDLWVNNIMLKHTNGKVDPVGGIKLIDFQAIDYGSPAIDVLFFLFTSVRTSLLRSHLDELFRYYYTQFVDTLRQFKEEINDFTLESFQNELREEAPYQIFHAVFMLHVIFLKMLDDTTRDGKTLEFKEKIWFMLEEADKRHWIYF